MPEGVLQFYFKVKNLAKAPNELNGLPINKHSCHVIFSQTNHSFDTHCKNIEATNPISNTPSYPSRHRLTEQMFTYFLSPPHLAVDVYIPSFLVQEFIHTAARRALFYSFILSHNSALTLGKIIHYSTYSALTPCSWSPHPLFLAGITYEPRISALIDRRFFCLSQMKTAEGLVFRENHVW